MPTRRLTVSTTLASTITPLLGDYIYIGGGLLTVVIVVVVVVLLLRRR
jgi:hypothetical protein